MHGWSQLTQESAPSCHDEEACSRVRHGQRILNKNIFLYNLNSSVSKKQSRKSNKIK